MPCRRSRVRVPSAASPGYGKHRGASASRAIAMTTAAYPNTSWRAPCTGGGHGRGREVAERLHPRERSEGRSAEIVGGEVRDRRVLGRLDVVAVCPARPSASRGPLMRPTLPGWWPSGRRCSRAHRIGTSAATAFVQVPGVRSRWRVPRRSPKAIVSTLSVRPVATSMTRSYASSFVRVSWQPFTP